jgi:hypothetical protein
MSMLFVWLDACFHFLLGLFSFLFDVMTVSSFRPAWPSDGGEHDVTLILVGIVTTGSPWRAPAWVRPTIRGEPAVGGANAAPQPCMR